MSADKACGCGCTGTTCGCCEGTEPLTPEATANRPWLPTIAYRVGVHGSFLETMKARLSQHTFVPPETSPRPLASLTTRDSDDPAVAFLDGWATVADVLTFYQERIANEGYLRTATELRSVYEMARLVGYKPRPGVAASVFLAYTIDANTKEEVMIPLGARVQSVPGPGELPQSFETSEVLPARAAWNVLKPRTMEPQRLEIVSSSHTLYFKGISTNLKVGDPLLLVNLGVSIVCRITKVETIPGVEPALDLTKVTLELWFGGTSIIPTSLSGPRGETLTLLEHPPGGTISDRVVLGLEPVKRVLADPQAVLLRSDADAAILLLDAELRRLGGLPAPVLRAWLNDLRAAVDAAVGTTAAQPGAAKQQDSLASVVIHLTKRPSQPLPNALRLGRSLETSFAKTSDANLQIMGTVAPALKDTLGPVLSTKGTDPAGLEVYAFRVRAGVFGRNAVKKQRIVQTGVGTHSAPGAETQVIGEWEIVTVRQDLNAAGAPAGTKKVAALTESANVIYLEGSHEGILPRSWIVVISTADQGGGDVMVRPTESILTTTIDGVDAKVTRAEYGLSGEATRLTFDRHWIRVPEIGDDGSQQDQPMIDRDFQVIRATTVFAQSEKLALAEAPIATELCGGAAENEPIELNGLYQDLQAGRFVVVTGERRINGMPTPITSSEPLMITRVVHDVRVADELVPWHTSADKATAAGAALPPKLPGDRFHTFVWFDKALSYCYRRDSVTIFGNVVKATHGETRTETLGGGDGAKSHQAFALKQGPVTYVAAPTVEGAESTLKVFVNDVRWKESDTFIEKGPGDHTFVTKTDDQAKTTIIFGNGHEGARLPTGIENVKAEYRIGIGKMGNARAGQISQLSTRPLGVKEVINPIRASGGADREGRDHVRRNAPNAVLALDRLVSTRDYADFTRSFAGIAKAAAVELSDGRRTIVHVTIAGMDDAPIDPGSDLFVNLGRALRELGDPFQPVEVEVRDLLILIIEAKIRIHPDYRWETVVSTVRTKLLATFGFEKRDLGQDVTSSEVLSVMQSVRGVAYVDLEAFGAIPSTTTDLDAEDHRRPATPDELAAAVAGVRGGAVPPRVRVEMARRVGGDVVPAQLAVLVPEVPATLVLNQIT